jgi:hypothetical protein
MSVASGDCAAHFRDNVPARCCRGSGGAGPWPSGVTLTASAPPARPPNHEPVSVWWSMPPTPTATLGSSTITAPSCRRTGACLRISTATRRRRAAGDRVDWRRGRALALPHPSLRCAQHQRPGHSRPAHRRHRRHRAPRDRHRHERCPRRHGRIRWRDRPAEGDRRPARRRLRRPGGDGILGANASGAGLAEAPG